MKSRRQHARPKSLRLEELEIRVLLAVDFTGDVVGSPMAPLAAQIETGEATRIDINTTISDSLSSANDEDIFQLDLSATGRLTISATLAPQANSPIALELFDPSGSRLATSVAGPLNQNVAFIQFHSEALIATESYFVRVANTRSDGQVVEYDLATEFLPTGEAFRPPISLPLPTAVTTLQLNDDNGDGLVNHEDVADLAAVHRPFAGLSLATGLGDGNFSEPSFTPFSIPNHPSIIRPAQHIDVRSLTNSDGFANLAVLSSQDAIGGEDPNPGFVTILVGDGSERFSVSSESPYFVGGNPTSLALGHINDDNQNGRLDEGDEVDLVITNAADGTLSILRGRDDGGFDPDAPIRVGDSPFAATIRDFNGDGRGDIAVVDRGSNEVVIVLQQSDGSFQTSAVPLPGAADGTEPVRPAAIAAGQLNDDNGDGVVDEEDSVDLVVANDQRESVTVLTGSRDGTFVSKLPIQLREVSSFVTSQIPNTALTLAHLDGDAHLDLVVANSNDPRVIVARGDGRGGFTPASLATMLSSVKDLVVEDFDSDGRLDLAALQDNAIEIVLGRGDGTFQSSQQNLAGSQPFDIVAADVNNDGIVDLITPNESTDSFTVLLGNGDGSYQTGIEHLTGDAPTSLEVGHFNPDGRLDLAITNRDAKTVSVHLGRGDGSFENLDQRHVFSVGSIPLDVLAIQTDDDNQDGEINDADLIDLVIANSGGDSNSLTLLRGSASEALFVTDGADATIAVGSRPSRVGRGDFDGDGIDDLAVLHAQGTSDEPEVRVLAGQGDGGFVLVASLSPTVLGGGPQSLAVADFDGDGRSDLAVVVRPDTTGDSSQLADLVILHAQDDHTFSRAPNSFRLSDAGATVFVGQFSDDNQDGIQDSLDHPDLAVVNRQSHTVQILLQENTLATEFVDSGTYPVGRSPFAAVALDANGDGFHDLAVANVGTGTVSVLLSDDQARFVDAEQVLTPAAGALPLFADLNADGTADVIVMNRAGEILLRTGRPTEIGVFDSPIVLNPTQPARDLAVVQLDGQTRVAAIDRGAPAISVYGTTAVGENSVTGSLITRFAVDAALPARVAAADLNGDALDDLVVSDSAGQSLSVYLAEANPGGDVRFVRDSLIGAIGQVSDLHVKDANNDDRLDLLVADRRTGQVGVLIADNDQYPSSGQFPAGGSPRILTRTVDQSFELLSRDESVSIATGDFNEDGQLDVASVNRGTNRLGILLGGGRGGLAAPVEFDTGSDPLAVRVADFNGDDHADLVVLNQTSRDITLLLGDGDGNFREVFKEDGSRYDAGNAPSGLAVRDTDGDTLVDLVISNEFGDVMVLAGTGSPEESRLFAAFKRTDRRVTLALGDIDGDQVVDWIVADEQDDQIMLQFGASAAAGGLAPSLDRPRVPIGSRAADVAAPAKAASAQLNDDNGDGIVDDRDWMDLVIANSGANNVLVYLGNGDVESPFDAAAVYFAGTNPVDIAIEDITGDGMADLVVTNEGSNDVSILNGTGDGTFSPGVRLDVESKPVETRVVFFNDDVIPDLLITSPSSQTTQVIPGIGGGFFNDVDPITYRDDSVRAPISANVIPGIGVYVVDSLSNTINVFEGFDRDYGAPTAYDTGGIRPVAAVLRDFNDDGALDLVVANNADGTISLLLAENGQFKLADEILGQDLQHPTALALADLGDSGDFALLVADEGDDLVSVFNREQIVPQPTVSLEAIFGIASTGISLTSLITVFATSLLSGPLEATAVESGDRSYDSYGSSGDPLATIQAMIQAVTGVLDIGLSIVDFALDRFDAFTHIEVTAEELAEGAGKVIQQMLPIIPWDVFASLMGEVGESLRLDSISLMPSNVDKAVAEDENTRANEPANANSDEPTAADAVHQVEGNRGEDDREVTDTNAVNSSASESMTTMTTTFVNDEAIVELTFAALFSDESTSADGPLGPVGRPNQDGDGND